MSTQLHSRSVGVLPMSELRYGFRPHAFAHERTYVAETSTLHCIGGRGERVLAFSDIAEVRLIRRRMRGKKMKWRCELRLRSGGKLVLAPLHYKRWRRWEDRSAAYVPFLNHLLASLRAANPDLRVISQQHWRLRLGITLRRLMTSLAWLPLVALLKVLQRLNADRVSDLGGRCLRAVGPRLRRHRIARANLAFAFPDKPPAEIERLLRGSWDNLGRVCAEYAHLDRLWDYRPDDPQAGRIVIDAASLKQFAQMREGGPTLAFAAHLANWEMAAIAAAALGLNLTAVYRLPRFGAATKYILAQRARTMGPLVAAGSGISDTAWRIRKSLRQGHHVGMLVDQHFIGGVEVNFFGRRCKANPTLARLARLYDCPIRGARAIRLPEGRFRVEVTEPIAAPRDHEGKLQIQGTMQVITDVIEVWVREHPDQWLWQHRRWR